MFLSERELQNDLSKFLSERGYITFTEIELKSKTRLGGRADIVALKPSYANKDCRIYEVKNNRACFLNDSKYLKYQDWCHRLYIACPKGLISKEEIPDGIGLIVRGEKEWRVIKAPKTNNPIYLEDSHFLLSLIYRGFESFSYQRELENRIIAKNNVSLKQHANKIGSRLGRKIAQVLVNDRDTKREDWSIEISNILKNYLDIEPYMVLNHEDNLVEPYKLERMLKKVKIYTDNASRLSEVIAYLDDLSSGFDSFSDIKKYLNEKES